MAELDTAAIVLTVAGILLLWLTLYMVHKHEREAEQLVRKVDICGKAEALLLKVEAQYHQKGEWKQHPHIGRYLAQAGYLLDHLGSFFEDADGIRLPSVREIPELQAELLKGSQKTRELFQRQTEALKLLAELDRFTTTQRNVIHRLFYIAEQFDQPEISQEYSRAPEQPGARKSRGMRGGHRHGGKGNE